jgi:hypothetical protein
MRLLAKIGNWKQFGNRGRAMNGIRIDVFIECPAPAEC